MPGRSRKAALLLRHDDLFAWWSTTLLKRTQDGMRPPAMCDAAGVGRGFGKSSSTPMNPMELVRGTDSSPLSAQPHICRACCRGRIRVVSTASRSRLRDGPMVFCARHRVHAAHGACRHRMPFVATFLPCQSRAPVLTDCWCPSVQHASQRDQVALAAALSEAERAARATRHRRRRPPPGGASGATFVSMPSMAPTLSCRVCWCLWADSGSS